MSVKILAFAGSTRKESLNKKLVHVAAEGARAAGAEVTVVDLHDYPMPLFDGDLEVASGMPEKALALKKMLREHDGLLIASPEYNSGYSAVLKNTIDWLSRQSEPGEKALSAFAGKYAALMSASPGALGGLRGLYQLRELMQNISVTVMPRMQSVPQAQAAFDEQGRMREENMAKSVAALGADLFKTLEKIKAA